MHVFLELESDPHRLNLMAMVPIRKLGDILVTVLIRRSLVIAPTISPPLPTFMVVIAAALGLWSAATTPLAAVTAGAAFCFSCAGAPGAGRGATGGGAMRLEGLDAARHAARAMSGAMRAAFAPSGDQLDGRRRALQLPRTRTRSRRARGSGGP